MIRAIVSPPAKVSPEGTRDSWPWRGYRVTLEDGTLVNSRIQHPTPVLNCPPCYGSLPTEVGAVEPSAHHPNSISATAERMNVA
jgi:hypothetical protein